MKSSLASSKECQICHLTKSKNELIAASLVRPSIVAEITNSGIPWSDEGFICKQDLNHFRTQHIQSILETEKGELTKLENEVLESIQKQETISTNVELEFQKQITFGERLSDKMADFGGSWKFILIFVGLILSWVILNSIFLLRKPFDPYPYILLNLVLSCLAAIQAPIILMSQNRQEDRDRLRAEYDYRVNLKAELEIRYLHEKLDHLLSHQWERLFEIQEIQIDLMNELAKFKAK